MSEFDPKAEEQTTAETVKLMKREFEEGAPFFREWIGTIMRVKPIEKKPTWERLALWQNHPPITEGMPTADVWYIKDPNRKQIGPTFGDYQQAQQVAQMLDQQWQLPFKVRAAAYPAWTQLSREHGSYFQELVKLYVDDMKKLAKAQEAEVGV